MVLNNREGRSITCGTIVEKVVIRGKSGSIDDIDDVLDLPNFRIEKRTKYSYPTKKPRPRDPWSTHNIHITSIHTTDNWPTTLTVPTYARG